MSTMTLQQIANNLDKSDNNNAQVDYFDFEELFELNNLHWDKDNIESFKKRVQGYWIDTYYCTDTIVGTIAYYFDGKFIAISSQPFRKSDKEFSFISRKDLEEFYNYVKTFEETEDKFRHIDIFGVNELVTTTYNLQFNGELIPSNHLDRAYYQGTKILSMSQVPVEKGEIASINKKMNIQLIDGTEKQIEIKDIDFKIHIKE